MKSGFAVLIGRSNVGKSTLMNTMVGTKIAATSFRAQMTRQVIHGAVNTPEGQIVFVDTPGIFKDKKNRLTGKLIEKAKEAIEGVDVILYVVDPSREIGDEEKYTYGLIRHLDTPIILVINKSDLDREEKKHLQSYLEWGQDFAGVFELSALRASHIQPLVSKVMELMPEGEAMYDDMQITNVSDKFWVAEIIREKVFSVFDKEVPYSITVDVDEMEDKPEKFVISARILTDAERYKKMIIGKGGIRIKEIGKMARRELEQALNKKIYLDLEVEVDTHWVDRV